MDVDRRRFLRLAGVGLGAVVLGGCRRGNPLVLPSPFGDVPVARDARPGMLVFAGAYDIVAGRRQRLPIGLSDPSGQTLVAADARAWLAPMPWRATASATPGGTASPAGTRAARGPVVGPFPLRYRRYDHARPEDPQGFYETEIDMPDELYVTLLVEARDGDRRFVGTTIVEAAREPRAPDVGDEAIAVATPTFAAPRGVANVCTLVPACPLHETRLDRALARRTPVLFTVSSPKLCTSRTCGPVLEEVVEAVRAAGDELVGVHAEPYAGNEATKLSPTMERWKLPSEPWVYLIDADGLIAARFEGPVTAEEITRAVRARATS